MALPVEVAEFFTLLSSFWFVFPLMVRQMFYLAFIILALICIMKFFR